MKKTVNRCPSCHSTLTYLRIRLQSFACRKCGHVWAYVPTTPTTGTEPNQEGGDNGIATHL